MYNNPILCAQPLVKRPIAAIKVPTRVGVRQPNLFTRYDTMGLMINTVPDCIDMRREVEPKLVSKVSMSPFKSTPNVSTVPMPNICKQIFMCTHL